MQYESSMLNFFNFCGMKSEVGTRQSRIINSAGERRCNCNIAVALHYTLLNIWQDWRNKYKLPAQVMAAWIPELPAGLCVSVPLRGFLCLPLHELILCCNVICNVMNSRQNLQIRNCCFYRTWVWLVKMATALTLKCPTCHEVIEEVSYDENDGNVRHVSYVMVSGDRIRAQMVRFVCRRCLLVQQFLIQD